MKRLVLIVVLMQSVLVLGAAEKRTISVEAVENADEGLGKTGWFLVSRNSGDLLDKPVPFRYSVGGDAVPGRTYCSLFGDGVIPAFKRSVKIKVIPLGDAKTTNDTSVVVRLWVDGQGGYAIGNGTASLLVVNGAKYGGHLLADAGPWNLIAHKGGDSGAPENSVEGCAAAVSNGFAFENDVRMTKEGRFYLSHDEVDPVPPGKDGFEESLKLVQPGVVYNVDAKCGSRGLDRLIETVRKSGAHKRGYVTFNSWNPAFGRRIHRDLPECGFWLPQDISVTTNYDWRAEADRVIAAVRDSQAQGISIRWDENVCTEEFFGRLNDAGIVIDVWTIDDMRTVKKAVNYGARYVTTNRPLRITAELPWAEPPRKEFSAGEPAM